MSQGTALQKSFSGQLEVIHKIAVGAPLEDVLASILKTIEARFEDSAATVVILDHSQDEERFYWASNASNVGLTEEFGRQPFTKSMSPWGVAAIEQAQVVTIDVGTWPKVAEQLAKHKYCACWCIPIVDSTRTVCGVLTLFRRTTEKPSDYELLVLQQYSVVSGLAIEKHTLQLENRYLKYHDFLTGLGNKRLFEEQLKSTMERADDTKRYFAVVLLNIRAFRDFNMTWGHTIGDQLLSVIANRLRESVGREDAVFRLGTDDFVVLIPDCNESDGRERVKPILDAILQPTKISGQHFPFQVSWGISYYPEDGKDYNSLLKNANLVMVSGTHSRLPSNCTTDR